MALSLRPLPMYKNLQNPLQQSYSLYMMCLRKHIHRLDILQLKGPLLLRIAQLLHIPCLCGWVAGHIHKCVCAAGPQVVYDAAAQPSPWGICTAHACFSRMFLALTFVRSLAVR